MSINDYCLALRHTEDTLITVLGLTLELDEKQRSLLSADGHCYVEAIGPNGQDLILIERIGPGFSVNSFHHGSTLALRIHGLA